MISPNQLSEVLQEMQHLIKFSIQIDDVEVYVTDITVHNGGVNVEFVTQYPEREEEIRPHVEACIMKLIRDEEQKECKSKGLSSRIWSRIRNTLRL